MSNEQTEEQSALCRLFHHDDQDSSMDRVHASTWRNQEAAVRSLVKEDKKTKLENESETVKNNSDKTKTSLNG